jgi:hypothetical protein
MGNLCVRCKGRGLCGHKCTIYEKLKVQKKVNLDFKKDFYGKTPNLFVGKFGYPNVNVGLLSTDFNRYDENDSPLLWSKDNNQTYSIEKIVNLRSDLVNSSFNSSIHSPIMKSSGQNKLNELSKEISLANKPTDVEINLKDKPQFKLSFNQEAAPHGPNVKIIKASITENIRVPTKVDKITSESDLKATQGLSILNKKFDEHYLTKLLSLGNLGVKTQRKLVPTRWAITAVDDSLGKDGINQIKNYSNFVDYEAYYGNYFGNYFLVLFFPDVWSYELFESYLPDSLYNQSKEIVYSTDHEFYGGRKEYVRETSGGYYASRLPVIEFLNMRKRQGQALILRVITSEYWAPLGVWVVREAVRKTLTNKPMRFYSKDLMLLYAKKLINKKFNVSIDNLLNKSKLLNKNKKQKKIIDF